MVQFIELLRVPSGKGQSSPFRLRDWQKQFIRDIYAPRAEDGGRRVRRAIFSVARKNGKALALDTRIPTPHGWTTMGDLEVGDELFDESGAVCRVTFATPVQLNRDCFTVRFADGTSVLADADHQWTVYSRSRHGRKLTLTTAQMKDDFILPYSRKGNVERNYSVDVAGPVDCPNADLLVAPYTLGAWLGDGKSAGACIYLHDDDREIIDNIRADGFPAVKGAADYEWRITDGVRNRAKDCLQSRLRKLGLLGAKRIPTAYLRGSIEQRLALLQGLMDTDGHVSKAGQCEFVSVDRGLACDVIELIRSLGHKATLTEDRARINGRDCGPRFRIQFWGFADFPVFRLARKTARLKPRPARSRNGRNYIVAIEPAESVPVRCIQVDSPSSLFLVGDGFTPTHNTALIAALVLVHLIGPEAVPNGEIYSAATDREQAGQVFKFARQMVEADPDLHRTTETPNGLIDVVPSTKTLLCKSNGSFYRALSAEAGTKHGLNPSVWIYDELAQATDRELYDVLRTSQGARQEPLGIIISTQSPDPEHPLSKLIDDGLVADDNRIVVHLYAVPDDVDDIFDEGVWRLANPALGDFREAEDLRALADSAARQPMEEASFRNLYLNQRVDQTSPLIPRSEWKACQAGDTGGASGLLRPKERIYLGLDLSAVDDLTALVGVSAEPGEERLGAWHWKPRDLLHDHAKRDRAMYDVWARPDQGWLDAPPGDRIDYGYVAKRIAELSAAYEVAGLAYDRWRIRDLLAKFAEIGVEAYVDDKGGDPVSGALRLVPWGQGYRDMAPAIDALADSVAHRRLKHNGNPVLAFCFGNAVVDTDPAGNRKLNKTKTRFRIDGAVAAAMAIGLKSREVVPLPPAPSPWDDPEFSIARLLQ